MITMLAKKVISALMCVTIVGLIAGSASSTPGITSYWPADGETGISLNPLLTAEIDSVNDTTVYFMFLDGETWVELGNTTGANFSAEVVTYQTDWSTYGGSYTYSINCTDVDGWRNSSAITITLISASEHSVDIIYGLIPVLFTFAFIILVLEGLGKIKF